MLASGLLEPSFPPRNGQGCGELELQVAQRNGVMVGIKIICFVHLLLNQRAKG